MAMPEVSPLSLQFLFLVKGVVDLHNAVAILFTHLFSLTVIVHLDYVVADGNGMAS
jgi:hypothetical protein